MHPDLSDDITLGEYADIEVLCIKNGLEKNMPEIMAVLFRPIIERNGSGYMIIEAYDGNITDKGGGNEKDVSRASTKCALVFFWIISGTILYEESCHHF